MCGLLQTTQNVFAKVREGMIVGFLTRLDALVDRISDFEMGQPTKDFCSTFIWDLDTVFPETTTTTTDSRLPSIASERSECEAPSTVEIKEIASKGSNANGNSSNQLDICSSRAKEAPKKRLTQQMKKELSEGYENRQKTRQDTSNRSKENEPLSMTATAVATKASSVSLFDDISDNTETSAAIVAAKASNHASNSRRMDGLQDPKLEEATKKLQSCLQNKIFAHGEKLNKRDQFSFVAEDLLEHIEKGKDEAEELKRKPPILKIEKINCCLCNDVFAKEKGETTLYRYCQECRGYICSKCNCESYHLSFQESLWSSIEEEERAEQEKEDIRKAKNTKKNRKKRQKRRSKRKASLAAVPESRDDSQEQREPEQSSDRQESARIDLSFLQYLQDTGSMIALASLMDELEAKGLDLDDHGNYDNCSDSAAIKHQQEMLFSLKSTD